MNRIAVFGATSAIAEAVLRIYAGRKARFFLVARDLQKLDAIAADLRMRGAAVVHIENFDALDISSHAALVETAIQTLGGLDLSFIAHGSLPDQALCQRDAGQALHEITINALSVVSLATHLGNHMEAQRCGTLAVISSVAADRGRQSNYVYGSAKALVDTFLSGLRHRLHPSGAHVVTIKPGFIDTPMTTAFTKGPLWSTPARIAPVIVRAIDRGQSVLYVPWFWRLILMAIRGLPQAVFVRTRL
jgi:decaprenylphospho-beta-D-erythro-pentofuranosid-2-ulose 2-reductase